MPTVIHPAGIFYDFSDKLKTGMRQQQTQDKQRTGFKNPFTQFACLWLSAVILLLSPGVGLPDDDRVRQDMVTTACSSSNDWEELVSRSPYPHAIPLVLKPSVLDGTRVKTAKKKGPIVPCRRCPDWVPYPGIWKLSFNRGTYRILHLPTGWRSIGTVIVSDSRILFANDPSCIDSIGWYEWQLEKGTLRLRAIDDDCAGRRREKNLSETAWLPCPPAGF